MWRKHKKKIWPALYLTALLAFTIYVGLDTFVIARPITVLPAQSDTAAQTSGGDADDAAAKAGAGNAAEVSGAEAEDVASGDAAEAGNDGNSAEADKSARIAGESAAADAEEETEGNSTSNSSGGKKKRGGTPPSGDASGQHDAGKPAPGSGKRPGKRDGASGSGTSDNNGEAGENASTASDSGAGQETSIAENPNTSAATANATASASSYSDGNISISLSTYREYDTDIYVADVTLSSSAYLKTAFADNTYGRNVTAKTSEIAESVNAILAVNGDFYGSQERGYVIRGGVIYRDTAEAGQEDLVIYGDGSFGIIQEEEITAQELLDAGAVDVLSFGPALIEDGQIAVSEGEEVGKAMASNPRTALAITGDGHYLFVVSDGRSDASEGLSLSQMAAFLQSLGAKTAYNLDGGGSSTMVMNGEVINNPTTGGSRVKERSVSDIVYIGY